MSISKQSNVQHEAIAAWFLGPKAENFGILRESFEAVLLAQAYTRKRYHPEDQIYITSNITESPPFNASLEKMREGFTKLLVTLDKYSIPFFSPRYSAHMCMENCVPAILGYLAAMLYNPNNVAFEASPITTLLELEVGQQLCKMFEFPVTSSDHPESVSWGHISCDGTVANLESIWAARNLKFYPLSLRNAMALGAPLEFVASTFEVTTCQGETKLFGKLEAWELLNLHVSTVLDLPTRLQAQYQISPTFLDAVMHKYIIQSVGKDVLERQWEIASPKYLIPATKHYSWPKGVAIAGIGSANAIDVKVDNFARLDTTDLEWRLDECVKNKQAVYAVVAVIGTTEEGAVDPLDVILDLRTRFQQKGLSFVVHADAAWGGYFRSMVSSNSKSKYENDQGVLVPSIYMCPHTIKQLQHLSEADSITIDPHKAGYVQYPAGALCYRDGRMKNLLTWTAPYLNQGSGESIGIYGVEGSKPGAAAAAVWLTHEVIRLNMEGMGVLLGEVSFTCRRFASHWSAMSDDKSDFIVVPFNPIPAELKPGSTPQDIEREKEFIRKNILQVENEDLTEDAMDLLKELGSALNINAFACNFRINGKVNTDVDEANYLNRRIFERLSITEPGELPSNIPFFITSTVFKEAEYGDCVRNFKKRLGLEGDQDLFVLRNVVMSPFSTSRNFVAELAKIFQNVLEEEIKVVRQRDDNSPDYHEFVVQGTGTRKYLVYRPMFQKFNSCYQVILSADIESISLKTASPNILKNMTKATLDDLMSKDFTATISTETGSDTIEVRVKNIQVVKKSSLNFNDRSVGYPVSFMPFYLYGTSGDQHISHQIVFDPNIQLCASNVSLDLGSTKLSAEDLKKGLIVHANGIYEQSMQPFPANKDLPKGEQFFFHPSKEFSISVFRDTSRASTDDTVKLKDVSEEPIAKGTLTLGKELFVDNDRINEDPWKFNSTSSGNMKEDTRRQWKHVLHDIIQTGDRD